MNCTWTNQMHHMTVIIQEPQFQTQSCLISKMLFRWLLSRDGLLQVSDVTDICIPQGWQWWSSSHAGARVQVILSNHRSDILDSTKDAGMIWVSIHRGLKWLKACSTFSYHIERHQAKTIAAMPEARKHKSELYVALCIKDFSNLVLFVRIR